MAEPQGVSATWLVGRESIARAASSWNGTGSNGRDRCARRYGVRVRGTRMPRPVADNDLLEPVLCARSLRDARGDVLIVY